MATCPLAEVAVGDALVVFPHETCPVDGTVVEGRGTMDESYLTGEPYLMSKAPGSAVLSGAINGDGALTIRAEQTRGRFALRQDHAGDARLGAAAARDCGGSAISSAPFYTPLAVAIALAPGRSSGDAVRFLAVLVVATPCPLLIAIPVAIIGSVSLAARRGIIIKDPAVLEKIDTCRTAIFDKTGTLTYGQPKLTEVLPADGFDAGRSTGRGGQPGALLAPPARVRPLIAAATRSQSGCFEQAGEVSERPGRRAARRDRRADGPGHQPEEARRAIAGVRRVASAARRRPGVRRADRRSLRGDVPVPRRTAGGRASRSSGT